MANTTALVFNMPPCDFCRDGTAAKYDFKTLFGPWANGCEQHYQENRFFTELGTGKGQELILRSNHEAHA